MIDEKTTRETFDVVIVAQDGRLTYEAVLFVASLRRHAPDFEGNVIVAEPMPGPLWPADPRIRDREARALLQELGAEVITFESRHFGASYPNGNKVEALAALRPGRPFVFFDTDTIITGPLDRIPFDFDHPSASMAREATWPEPPLYGPGYEAIWRCLYDRFAIPFEPTLDPDQPDEHWEKYLYFNAGWFFYRCPRVFAETIIPMMLSIRDDTPRELAAQSLYPWLDQIALPLAITALGGGRPGPEHSGLDGSVTCHWRVLPLFFARADERAIDALYEAAAPNKVKRVLKSYEPFRRMIFQRRGEKVRALFDPSNLPREERAIRNRIKREKLWMR